jgi:transglycosylase-like protein with SLT domain/peptidase M23-like protein
MKIRLLYTLLVAALVAVAAVGLGSLPANAELKTVQVRLDSGELVSVQVDVPPGTPLEDIEIPTVPDVTEPDDGSGDGGGSGGSGGTTDPGTPESTDQQEQKPSKTQDGTKNAGDEDATRDEIDLGPGAKVEGPRDRKRKTGDRLRNPDGSPTRSNPTFFDALPGPARVTGVPNFVIRKFQVPVFLLSIYQAAGIQYGVHWQVLAAINEIETDYGRNLNVSSAGAVGWMQFLPSTWRMYGVDANSDGKKDPYNPVDAIFAAARYLKAAGYEESVRRAIFAYNHADWYVDSVLLRATRIKQMPDDFVSSLTGLTEGRFPVAARARYADDISELEAQKRFERGENAANVVEDSLTRRGIDIFAREGSPVVAVNDGVIKKIGQSRKLGRHIVLQDVYGNRFTYAHLGSVSQSYPVPKDDAINPDQHAQAISANDKKPSRPASAGRQLDTSDSVTSHKSANAGSAPAPRPTIPLKERLFAHPERPNARDAGGDDQILSSKGKLDGFTTFRNYFSRAFGLNARDVRLKSLQEGSRVIGGTILGRIGETIEGKAAHVYFEIQPVGRGAPRIDPKPILDGWKLLEATAIYRAAGENALYGDDETSIGQILLMPKPLLEKRVLADERIELYPCGSQDVQSGQIDRRVLATLEVLAERGFRTTVTSLKCGHSFYTSSGNVSQHSSGNAVDIAAVNGIPILGHQEPGGIADQVINVLLQMQGTLQADQIISLIEKGGPTFAMADHNDHIHVGFQPLFGANTKQGMKALAILKPDQWDDLIGRLREIDNPTVPTKTSKFAIPVEKHRSSDAHQGE